MKVVEIESLFRFSLIRQRKSTCGWKFVRESYLIIKTKEGEQLVQLRKLSSVPLIDNLFNYVSAFARDIENHFNYIMRT